jgi:endoglucanase
VFAADLNNEPHGSASWGDGNPSTDWRAGAERLGAAVLAANPRLLCFVEGTSGNAVPLQTPEPCFWGGGLCSAVAAPVNLPVPRRLVLSPHVYGPGVFLQSYFQDPAFPANMPDIWTRQWAHPVLCGCEGGPGEGVPAIVPGEWGGRFEAGSLERTWALAFAQWQRETGLTDSFFWCLNPNSGDTGGLLSDDWQRPEEWKLALLAAINPAPTRFGPDGSVVDPGGGAAYAQPVGPLPAALTAGVDMTPRGGNGGGGPGPSAAPAPAPAPTQPPPPPAAGVGLEASATHPSGLRLTSRVTSSWAAGPRTAYQMDVTITNEGGAPVPDVVWAVEGDPGLVEQAWNCERAAGGASFSLPAWCVQNGGLGPGASVTAGGVFFDAQPAWTVRPA